MVDGTDNPKLVGNDSSILWECFNNGHLKSAHHVVGLLLDSYYQSYNGLENNITVLTWTFIGKTHWCACTKQYAIDCPQYVWPVQSTLRRPVEHFSSSALRQRLLERFGLLPKPMEESLTRPTFALWELPQCVWNRHPAAAPASGDLCIACNYYTASVCFAP